MNSYTIRSKRNQQIRSMLSMKGETTTVKYDYSPWETDNGSVSAVVWSVESGQASIGNDALASSIASAEITTSETGSSLIKVTATAGNNVYVHYLRVKTKEPYLASDDYGLCL